MTIGLLGAHNLSGGSGGSEIKRSYPISSGKTATKGKVVQMLRDGTIADIPQIVPTAISQSLADTSSVYDVFKIYEDANIVKFLYMYFTGGATYARTISLNKTQNIYTLLDAEALESGSGWAYYSTIRMEDTKFMVLTRDGGSNIRAFIIQIDISTGSITKGVTLILTGTSNASSGKIARMDSTTALFTWSAGGASRHMALITINPSNNNLTLQSAVQVPPSMGYYYLNGDIIPMGTNQWLLYASYGNTLEVFMIRRIGNNLSINAPWTYSSMYGFEVKKISDTRAVVLVSDSSTSTLRAKYLALDWANLTINSSANTIVICSSMDIAKEMDGSILYGRGSLGLAYSGDIQLNSPHAGNSADQGHYADMKHIGNNEYLLVARLVQNANTSTSGTQNVMHGFAIRVKFHDTDNVVTRSSAKMVYADNNQGSNGSTGSRLYMSNPCIFIRGNKAIVMLTTGGANYLMLTTFDISGDKLNTLVYGSYLAPAGNGYLLAPWLESNGIDVFGSPTIFTGMASGAVSMIRLLSDDLGSIIGVLDGTSQVVTKGIAKNLSVMAGYEYYVHIHDGSLIPKIRGDINRTIWGDTTRALPVGYAISNTEILINDNMFPKGVV